MNELALFAGAGGGILASYLLGWRTVCAVERDAYAAQVLAQRQNDGILEAFPIWSDITSFDGKPWQGIVDVISGGFPCQDISSAGKGAGIEGERSGLWSEMARIIGEVRPRYVFVENSPMLVSRGLTRVIRDLAKMGYEAQWARFSASNFGAPHIRDRLWIVAYTNSTADGKQYINAEKGRNSHESLFDVANSNCELLEKCRASRQTRWIQLADGSKQKNFNVANTSSFGLQRQRKSRFPCDSAENSKRETNRPFHECFQYIWSFEPELGRVANGVAHRMDRLKAIGNGQVSIVAKSAFEYLGGEE